MQTLLNILKMLVIHQILYQLSLINLSHSPILLFFHFIKCITPTNFLKNRYLVFKYYYHFFWLILNIKILIF